MARKTLRTLIETPFGSEWSRLVRRIQRQDARRFLIVWNRGLGDIALGLARVIFELRRVVPDADISVLTRAELAEAFVLVRVDDVLVDPDLVRGGACDVTAALARLGRTRAAYDVILARPDPTHWFRGRPGPSPRLAWPSHCNELAHRFDALFDARRDDPAGPRIDIAVHVQSETGAFYQHRKDWPLAAWQALFERLRERHPVRFVLFGHRADPGLELSLSGRSGIDHIDLRGKTTFLEMMSVIKNRCRILIAPDSGVLTMTYYLDVETRIDVISLWSDPRQGILKQGTASPNPLLVHRAVRDADERVENIAVETVVNAVEAMLEKWTSRSERETEFGLMPH